jgi:hypothetical protein
VAALGIVGCWHDPAPVTPVVASAPPVVVVPAIAPIDRARAIIEAQIAAADLDTEEARRAAVQATFAPGVVVRGFEGDDGVSSSQFDKVAIDQLVAGGTADVVWFHVTFADIAPNGPMGLTYRNPSSPASWYAASYVGVAARSAGWKIVGAAITDDVEPIRAEHHRGPSNLTSRTGAVTQLVLDGPALAAAIAPDAIVIEPDAELHPTVTRGPAGLGAHARRALVLDPNGREVSGPGWTITEAQVADPDADLNFHLFALAIPKPNGGGWTPVLVDYIGE